jgi:hypothetical protein
MHHSSLRLIAKIGACLVALDFLVLLWSAEQGLFPLQCLGVDFGQGMIIPAIVFDIALFVILMHYGWNVGKIPHVRERTYLFIAGAAFSIVGIMHAIRLFDGTTITAAGWSVPLWLSWIGVAVAAYLAYTSFFFALRPRRSKSR